MSALASLVNHPAAGFLAWSLVHFLWQGALLALGMLLFFRWRKPDAATRYAIGVATLAAMLAAPVVTFAYLSSQSTPIASRLTTAVETNVALIVPPDAPGQPLAPLGTSTSATSATLVLATRLAVLAVWLVGVTGLSLRLFRAWISARRLVTYGIRPVTHDIETIARRVAGRLALDRVVRVVESAVVTVPIMVGWLKPVVLFPASALSGLTADQVEALIAHELAHVRRHDYLVNLMQSFVETLLFYHPAVWWVSRQVRTEREHCCDDLAVGVCDRVVYVSALTELASMVTSHRVALAATDGSLLRRVRRILTASGDDSDTGAGWLPAIMIVLVVGATAATLRLTPRAAAQGQPPPPVTAGASGGVQGGVAAGVPGGVAAGVLGGVATTPLTAARTTLEQASAVQDQTLTEAQRLELAAAEKRERVEQDASAKEIARKIEARRAELEKALAEIEQARFALELRKADSESQVKIETLQSNLGQLRSEQERAKKMVEVGTLNPSELKELEAKIRALELELHAVAEDRNFRKQDLDFRIKEVEQKRQYESAVSEYESLIKNYNQQHEASDFEEIVKRKLLTEEKARGADLLEHTTQITSATEPIRSGDILRIEIAGEPDLPVVYVVSEAGAVRLPLIGSVTVRGLTLREAPAAIAKQLTDRKLASTTVKVSLFRPQGREQ